MGGDKVIHVLDYGAGNLQSLLNAVRVNGYEPHVITTPEQLKTIKKLIFPGVGAFGSAMAFLQTHGFVEPLREFLRTEGNQYMGICIGMQVLFESSEESPGIEGLGVIKGTISRFTCKTASVPNIGWSGISPRKPSRLWWNGWETTDRVYFVHSYRATESEANKEWVAATTTYGGEQYVSAVQRGTIMAVQFHPEKSGKLGLRLLAGFLDEKPDNKSFETLNAPAAPLSRRIVACLDVRTNDDGDLVVTKGDSYDVRESTGEDGVSKKGRVRNLGKPVELAKRYYEEGADEVTFLNITSFRSEPLEDAPLLEVLEETSKTVFVPLTIGGGIRDYTDVQGRKYSSLNVADRYFRAGADKISIGSDAVMAAERVAHGRADPDGTSSIEQISRAYGAQAVVISVDPRRVYLDTDEQVEEAKKQGHTIVEVFDLRPGCAAGSRCRVWFQCTIKGGREGRNLDAVELARACERLGAGEILLNSIDCDGQKKGFDLDLVNAVCSAVKLPVIASSGAGSSQHFVDVFNGTRAEAALAAGIFHRNEVPLPEVKKTVRDAGLEVR